MTIESDMLTEKVLGTSLNPYSNGMTIELLSRKGWRCLACLNPYSNGMTIEFNDGREFPSQGVVLILILME